MQAWLFRNARRIDPTSGRDDVGDVCLAGGLLVPPSERPRHAHEIDASGLTVTPGFIDVHVHFRDPGNPKAETLASGSAAAARGGFTCVVPMPNTRPPVDSSDRVAAMLRQAGEPPRVRILPAGCLTQTRQGLHVADLEGMAAAGAVAFTDDGSTVQRREVLLEAMHRARALNRPVMDHALDPALAGRGVMHDGSVAKRLGLPGIASEAETRIVERDIALCEATGCRVHIQHVSAADSVSLIRAARRRGLAVSGEATPHHLACTDADAADGDSRFKMNPPLRSEQDRQALLKGVADGVLDVLATDHAPHPQSEKARGFLAAPFGVIGLETAVGVSYGELVTSGMLTVSDWVERWTVGPARLLGLPAPTLAEGAPADITVLNLAAEWVVDPRHFASTSRNTPFEGKTLTGQAVWTFCAGRPAWSPQGHDA